MSRPDGDLPAAVLRVLMGLAPGAAIRRGNLVMRVRGSCPELAGATDRQVRQAIEELATNGGPGALVVSDSSGRGYHLAESRAEMERVI